MGIVGTIEIRFATRTHFCGFATRASVSTEPGRTFACVARNPVDAKGSEAATIERSAGTFVNVCKYEEVS